MVIFQNCQNNESFMVTPLIWSGVCETNELFFSIKGVGGVVSDSYGKFHKIKCFFY